MTEKGEAEAEETSEAGAEVEFVGEFDEARAKKAIANSRAAEKAGKEKAAAEIAELRKELAGFKTEQEAKAEAEKGLEVKLAEANATISNFEQSGRDRAVREDFMAKATERGYADSDLAYVAAQAQGALGELAKDGSVGDHDFEALEASHSTFAAEAGATGDNATGDAAAKSGGKAKTEAERFNESIRGQFGLVT